MTSVASREPPGGSRLGHCTSRSRQRRRRSRRCSSASRSRARTREASARSRGSPDTSARSVAVDREAAEEEERVVHPLRVEAGAFRVDVPVADGRVAGRASRDARRPRRPRRRAPRTAAGATCRPRCGRRTGSARAAAPDVARTFRSARRPRPSAAGRAPSGKRARRRPSGVEDGRDARQRVAVEAGELCSEPLHHRAAGADRERRKLDAHSARVVPADVTEAGCRRTSARYAKRRVVVRSARNRPPSPNLRCTRRRSRHVPALRETARRARVARPDPPSPSQRDRCAAGQARTRHADGPCRRGHPAPAQTKTRYCFACERRRERCRGGPSSCARGDMRRPPFRV